MIGNSPSDFVRLFIRQFLWTVWRWIIRFREPVYSRHLPSAKSRKDCLWGRGRLYTGWSQTDNPFLALVWKRPITKSDPVSSVFNDSNGQYRTTVCRWLVRRPHYSARLKRFGSRGPSVFFFFFSDTLPKYFDREGVGRRHTRTRHGNVYRSVREKQGVIVYRQCVLQTVTSSRVVSQVFPEHDLLKIANINPQQEGRFSLCKKLVPRESGGNED